jgi:hypothetical protein
LLGHSYEILKISAESSAQTQSIGTLFVQISLQQKWGKTEQYLVRYPIMAHFPQKKKQLRGCQKGWKTKFNQTWFSAFQTTPHYVRSTSVAF